MAWRISSTGSCKPAAALLAGAVFLCLAGGLAAKSPGYDDLEIIAKLRAMDLYPDAVNTGSPLNKAMQQEVDALEKRDPAYFDNPNWPLLLAQTIAKRLSIDPATQSGPGEEDRAIGATAPTAAMVITKATFGLPGAECDVTRKIAGMVVNNTLEVRCGVDLLPSAANWDDYGAMEGETAAEFVRRQVEVMHFQAVYQTGAPLRSGTGRGEATAETPVLKVNYKIGAKSGSAEAAEGAVLRLP
jgi:hypothetical protein